MIEFHGDSTQYGTIVNSGSTVRSRFVPSDIVDRLLGVSTSNFSVPGSTLNDALTGAIYPSGRNFSAQIALSSADVIVANWGINDAFLVGITPAIQKTRWETARDICHGYGKAFVIQTANPINLSHNTILGTLVDASKTVENVGISDIYSQVQGYFEDWRTSMDTADVHPNERLYMWIGARMARDLERIMGVG